MTQTPLFVLPAILVRCLGSSPYMMPDAMLPLMDCETCLHKRFERREDAHCYMFRERPVGDRCGQFRAVKV